MIALTFLKQNNQIQVMYENTKTRSFILLAVSVEDPFFFFCCENPHFLEDYP